MAKIIELLDASMTRPEAFGWFHLLWWALMIGSTVFLCKRFGNDDGKNIRRVVFYTALIAAVLEVYKQINFTFSVEDGKVVADYQWYAFPFQFCSMPMVTGLLTGIFRKGKIHRGLCAFLASYAIFAGVCIMIYPNDVFIETIGVNIETMFCHASMIPVGVMLLYSGYVTPGHRTVLKALPVFASAVGLASVFNEIAYYSGLLERESFNMFYISPHQDPHLPVYSVVQEYVPFPWCLIIYILVFTLAAYLMVLIYMGVAALSRKLFGKKVKTAEG